jgi:hypothetical protein
MKNLGMAGDDLDASFAVVVITKANAYSCLRLNDDLMAVFEKLIGG